MAGRSNGDVVLGGRHLVGIFALLVVVLGIVFTLGYLLGRSRYEGPARAVADNAAAEGATGPKARAADATSPDSSARAEAPANWDFYRSGEPAKTPALQPSPSAEASIPPKPAATPPQPVEPAPARAPVAATRSTAALPAPAPGGSALIPKGAITLQVAALTREADALALAQVLQEKKFPAIVTTPSTDKYYRVQVGPYSDTKSAAVARGELEKQGFKSIMRR